jgi:hypothetical protein
MSTAKSLDQHIKKNCKHPDIEEYRANANTRSARQSPVTFEQALVPLENDTISADQTVLNQEVIVQEGAFVQERQQPEKEKEDQEFTEIESNSSGEDEAIASKRTRRYAKKVPVPKVPAVKFTSRVLAVESPWPALPKAIAQTKRDNFETTSSVWPG